MAKYKRFYFPSSGTPNISPAYGNMWDYYSYASRGILSPIKTNSIVSRSNDIRFEGSFTSGSRLAKQFISQELPEQIVPSGTIKGVVDCSVSNGVSYHNSYLSLSVRICDNLGNHVNDIINFNYDDNKFSTSFYSRLFTNQGEEISYNTFHIPHRGRIIIEIGCFANNKPRIAESTRYYFGDSSLDDIAPYENIRYQLYNPWIEFSNYINYTFEDRIYGNPLSMLIW
jgi:hypothetical protein